MTIFKFSSSRIFKLKFFTIFLGITKKFLLYFLIKSCSLISFTSEILLRFLLKPLIKYFSLNLIKQKIKSFLLKNFAQDSIKVLYPTKFKSFDKLIPFAVANDPLNPEKFPGPSLTKMSDKSSSFRLFSLKKSKICFINKSILDLSLCKTLLNVLFLTFTNNEPLTVLQSIDKKFIVSLLILLLLSISKSFGEVNLNEFNPDKGVIALMYHRFNENKYPSTNIRNEIFLEHLAQIKNSKIEFISFNKFREVIKSKMDKNYLLLTIDDAFESFYSNAWPVLKERKIPFILFVSTREMNKNGYMTWEQIKEIESSGLATIGNHSHTHEYLIDWEEKKIRDDLEKSIKIFKKELGYSPKLFSYPFGEYSTVLKKIVTDLNFEFAFGQHSGVIDSSKDFLELPRFPINEKYGELKRFKSIIQTLPFPYEKITPENRYIKENENPPKVKVKFFKDLIDVKNITCYSNEGNVWRKSDIVFIKENQLNIILKEKFKSERGRINCTLAEAGGKWRWLGIQYVVAEY